MSRLCPRCGYTEHYGMHSCAEELKKDNERLRRELEQERGRLERTLETGVGFGHRVLDQLAKREDPRPVIDAIRRFK